ncbi:unnamed protein product [Paramecium sonneborni]|uniref:Uncharacterized protein n=1 Tax=Paramecium sonneborni TaxID=65129 RepID=A0A8S1RLT8_9CILI|nr:unnamed protein product [Paramecium sonneborni]
MNSILIQLLQKIYIYVQKIGIVEQIIQELQLLILLIINYSNQNECSCDQLDENDCQLSKRCKMNQDQCQFKSCQDYLITECNYIQDCILENNKCIDHVWGRCADIPIEVCELNENCAINNENKCEEFTRCEDYQMNGNEDCNKKNENCYNGKEGYCKSKIQIGNCQQVEMECEMYKIQNKQYCVASTDNKCISIQVTQCSNMNGTPACSLYNECDWNISTSICREKRCNDLDEQNCNGELKNLNGETMICYWENGQCLKMQSRDDLSQSNCYLATIGQSTWKEGKCQECIQLSQLVILIYYLIYIL